MDSNPTTTSDPHLVDSTRLLSEEQFDDLNSRPYDQSWLDVLGLSSSDETTLLEGFTSKIKIDELIRGGAIISGDVFRANVVTRMAGYTIETKTVAMQAEFCGASPYSQLNIRIRSLHDSSGYRTVNCSGLGKIIHAWRQEDPLIIDGSSSYRNFHVNRNGTELGSLWQIRQKWNLWREEKEAWAKHRGEIGRHKRVTKEEKNEGYSYVRGRLTRTRTQMRTDSWGDGMGGEDADADADADAGDVDAGDADADAVNAGNAGYADSGHAENTYPGDAGHAGHADADADAGYAGDDTYDIRALDAATEATARPDAGPAGIPTAAPYYHSYYPMGGSSSMGQSSSIRFPPFFPPFPPPPPPSGNNSQYQY